MITNKSRIAAMYNFLPFKKKHRMPQVYSVTVSSVRAFIAQMHNLRTCCRPLYSNRKLYMYQGRATPCSRYVMEDYGACRLHTEKPRMTCDKLFSPKNSLVAKNRLFVWEAGVIPPDLRQLLWPSVGRPKLHYGPGWVFHDSNSAPARVASLRDAPAPAVRAPAAPVPAPAPAVAPDIVAILERATAEEEEEEEGDIYDDDDDDSNSADKDDKGKANVGSESMHFRLKPLVRKRKEISAPDATEQQAGESLESKRRNVSSSSTSSSFTSVTINREEGVPVAVPAAAAGNNIVSSILGATPTRIGTENASGQQQARMLEVYTRRCANLEEVIRQLGVGIFNHIEDTKSTHRKLEEMITLITDFNARNEQFETWSKAMMTLIPSEKTSASPGEIGTKDQA